MINHVDAAPLWIIRHGRPDVPANRWRVSRDEFNRYLEAYDLAGLGPAERDRLEAFYARYEKPDLVLTSDLPRAYETARLFARGAEIEVHGLLREVPVLIPNRPGWFLANCWPTEVWWSYLRLAWFRGHQAEVPAASYRRAQTAIELLAEKFVPYRRIAVVSHSGFLLILVHHLHRQRLIAGQRWPSIDFGRPTPYQWLRQPET